MSPRLDSASPTQIITAPNITVQRTPTRSATCPMTMPPAPKPIQANALLKRGHRAQSAGLGRDLLQRNDA